MDGNYCLLHSIAYNDATLLTIHSELGGVGGLSSRIRRSARVVPSVSSPDTLNGQCTDSLSIPGQQNSVVCVQLSSIEEPLNV